MGVASQASSVVLRIGELICASIVAGTLGRYLYLLSVARVDGSSRIVYSVAIAGISIFFSIVFMPPLKYSFRGFSIDFSLFICWIVAFGLLDNLTGSGGCNSYWYWHTWGYYWGRWYYTVPIDKATNSLVGAAYCSQWRSVLAFSFIGAWLWVANGFLGLYICMKDRTRTRTRTTEMSSAGDLYESNRPTKDSTENSGTV